MSVKFKFCYQAYENYEITLFRVSILGYKRLRMCFVALHKSLQNATHKQRLCFNAMYQFREYYKINKIRPVVPSDNLTNAYVFCQSL